VTMIGSCVFLDKLLVEEPGIWEVMQVHQRMTIAVTVQVLKVQEVQEEIQVQAKMQEAKEAGDVKTHTPTVQVC